MRPGFKKGPAKPVKAPSPRLPQHEERKMPRFDVQSLASKVIKPVGAAVLLLATVALGQQSITAPGGNQGACPFPGCKQESGRVVVTDPPYSVSAGTADQTGKIQQAIDSGAGLLIFPPGVYTACQLMPRAASQRWIGAGKGKTILRGPTGCANLILTNAQGPSQVLGLEAMTLDGATTNVVNMNGRDLTELRVRDVGVDVAGAPGDDGTIGFSIAGTRLVMDTSEIYSSHPSFGQGFNILRGAHNSVIRNSTIKWTNSGMNVGSTGNVGTGETVDGFILEGNQMDLGWWALPAIFTNSGGTVTYAATTLTDTAANFTGLCNGTGGPGTCSAGTGANVRVMTARGSTTSAVSFFKGGIISNTGINWVSLGVTQGDLVRTTTKFCTGNGGQARFTGVIGTDTCPASGGDRCPCTAASQCASGVCEFRFATVTNANTSTTTDVVVDEWTADGDGVGGSVVATRRPTGAPPDGAIVTIYGWVLGEVGSYTSTVITLATKTGGWVNWSGTASTPSAGTLYEVMPKHPNYALQGLQTLRNATIVNNRITRGWSDCLNLFGTQHVVSGNTVTDCQDHCFNIQGSSGTIIGNRADHCGARGIGVFGDDNIITGNVASNTPWVNNLNTTSLADLFSAGMRNVWTNNLVRQTLPVASNRYGLALNGTTANTDNNRLVNHTCQGTYTVGCIRLDGANVTNLSIGQYHGEVISNNAGTFTIEGGRTTQALGTANAAGNGSYFGCSDCTVANPCAGGGTGAFAKRQGGAWVCN